MAKVCIRCKRPMAEYGGHGCCSMCRVGLQFRAGTISAGIAVAEIWKLTQGPNYEDEVNK